MHHEFTAIPDVEVPQAGTRSSSSWPVPAIYGPSGDMTWDEADPTYSVEAANRGA